MLFLELDCRLRRCSHRSRRYFWMFLCWTKAESCLWIINRKKTLWMDWLANWWKIYGPIKTFFSPSSTFSTNFLCGKQRKKYWLLIFGCALNNVMWRCMRPTHLVEYNVLWSLTMMTSTDTTESKQNNLKLIKSGIFSSLFSSTFHFFKISTASSFDLDRC